MDKKKFIIYMIFAFGLAWVIQIIGSIFAREGNIGIFQLFMMVCMYMPFVATLIAKVPLKGMGWIPKIKKDIKVFLLLWFGPAILTILGAVIYYALFPDRMDWSGSYLVTQVGEEAFAQMQASGFTIPLYLVVSIISAITAAPFINGFLGLGEEVGWRGVMYPMLKDKLGRVKGMIVGGIIWGAWHWPVMIFAGYEYGVEYWGAPVLGMVMFCLYATVAGIILDVCYEKTSCIWAPSIGHGAINAAAGIPVIILNTDYANQLTVGPLPIGIISMIPYLLVAVFLVIYTEKRRDKLC